MTHIKRILSTALLTLAGLSGNAFADTQKDHHLVLSTAAWHFEKSDERNDFTPGIGWEYSPSGRIGFHLGTLSDSFGYQARYAGLNIATPRFRELGGRVRFLLGATILHKQYRPNAEPDTKVVPLPAIEFAFAENAVLNVSGSPEIDYEGHHNNAVVFFQVKLGLL